MKYARLYKKSMVDYINTFALIFTFFVPVQAKAAAITNLDDKPHLITAHRQDITIPPGRTWRETGPVTVNFNGREVRIDSYQEFAIWNDSDFGPQRLAQPRGESLSPR